MQGNEKGGWCWPCLFLFVLLMHVCLLIYALWITIHLIGSCLSLFMPVTPYDIFVVGYVSIL